MDIDAPEAWDIQNGDPSIIVAVLDTGVRYYHKDLGGSNASSTNPMGADGNVWITDARGEEGRGHQVIKFDANGKELMRLGKAGIAGDGNDEFNQPSDVLIAPNGDIFVADGHGAEGNNRIVKFASDGTFIKTWGTTGAEAGEFRDPHALAMDSKGRLFVGDRGNSRIQIFDQDGNWIATWTQFGRPSGLFIDKNDILYSADSESHVSWSGNWGWKRGIRIGSVRPSVLGKPSWDPEVIAGYVLSDPPPDERELLDQAVERAIEAIELVIADGVERAMTQYN